MGMQQPLVIDDTKPDTYFLMQSKKSLHARFDQNDNTIIWLCSLSNNLQTHDVNCEEQ